MARPSNYRVKYLEPTRKLIEAGATEQEVADVIGIKRDTLIRWAKQNPAFRDALKMGKDGPDQRVERSLYHRAIGYSFDAKKIFQHEGKPVIVPYREHIPPDTTACIFWLKNRRPDLWRDKVEFKGSFDHRHAVSEPQLTRLGKDQLEALEGVYSVLGVDEPAENGDMTVDATARPAVAR